MTATAISILVYSVQVLLVVCAATVAVAAIRVPLPSARLQYWRAVAVLCLALPLLASSAAVGPGAAVAFGTLAAIGTTGPRPTPLLSVSSTVIPWVIASGALARLLWLAAGAWRLRRLRHQSAPATLGSEVDTLRAAVAPQTEFRWTDELTQPVTFGARRPVVLLPRRFASLHPEAQQAVLCHELLHVARRDFLWIVAEEHLRALFWFHPAIWWVLGQVQLSREQAIDQLVVARTASRGIYMSALMYFADADRSASPAMAFLRRPHLTSRLRQLSKESSMSPMRLACATVALLLVMGGVTTAIVSALPLNVAGLVAEQRATTLEIRLAETQPAAGLTEATVSGSGQHVYLHPEAVATAADVTSARVVDDGTGRFSIGVAFSSDASSRITTATRSHFGKPVAIVLDGRVIAAPVLRGPIGDSAMITGDFTRAEADAIAAALTPGVTAGADRPQPFTSKDKGVVLPVVVKDVKPGYTAAAMKAKITGAVSLSVVIEADGTVGEVSVTKSLDTVHGMDHQAVEAAKQWRFKPGMKDGKPVAVRVDITMTFTLK